MFVTFFEEFGDFKPIKHETHGAFLRRKALSMHTMTIDTRHIDSVRRVFDDGKWKNIVSVFEGANEFYVEDDTYLKLIESLTIQAFNGEENLNHFKMIPRKK